MPRVINSKKQRRKDFVDIGFRMFYQDKEISRVVILELELD